MDNKFRGRWTHQEHLLFLQGLRLFGKNWKKIEKIIGTRNGAQIRSHAQKFFNKFETKNQNQHFYQEEQRKSNSNQAMETQMELTIEKQSYASSYIIQHLYNSIKLSGNLSSVVFSLMDFNEAEKENSIIKNSMGFQLFKKTDDPGNITQMK